MYQLDSENNWGSKHLTQTGATVIQEAQVVALPLPPEASEFGSSVLEVEGKQQVVSISSDRSLEQLISYLLRYGVLLSSAIVLTGGILYLMRYGAEPADYRFFQGEPAVLCSPDGVVIAALSGSCRGFIQFGLLLLIATPVARVVFSFLAFLRRRDFAYVILTLFVLIGLSYSFIGTYF
ncbi:MAG: DUF1634 domain-containing protein [Cyanobacteriota bacterium]